VSPRKNRGVSARWDSARIGSCDGRLVLAEGVLHRGKPGSRRGDELVVVSVTEWKEADVVRLSRSPTSSPDAGAPEFPSGRTDGGRELVNAGSDSVIRER